MLVEFRVLGPLEVLADGAPLRLGGGKQQLVLAALLLEPNRVVSVERLIEWVWGDDDTTARNSTLQVYVSNLRRLLTPAAEASGRPFVVTQRPGYSLQIEGSELDSLRFEELRAAAERARHDGAPHEAVVHLRGALDLWRGEPLAGLPLGTVAQGELSRLEMARTATIEQLAETELEIGRHRQVVDELRGWVADQPLDERLRGLLMVALYRCGLQAEALATFREGRELLVEDLGIDPSKGLRDLERQILNQDPVLDLLLPPTTDPVKRAGSTVLRSSVVAAAAHLLLDGAVVELSPGVTTIGRLPDRDVIVLDSGASRLHAEIRSTPEGFILIDSGSANGTVIDGQRVRQHLLADRDVIRIGETEIEFRLGAPDRPAAADQP